MITKSQACYLFKYDFKLVDKEGNEWLISSVNHGRSFIDGEPDSYSMDLIRDVPHGIEQRFSVGLEEIGSDYHILAYHHSCLTKQINGVIPIHVLDDMDGEFKLMYDGSNLMLYDICDVNLMETSRVKDLFDKLYSLHFLPHGIEESNVKWIEL